MSKFFDRVDHQRLMDRLAPVFPPSSPDFVLEAQPPAQPHRRVSIERPIRLADGSYPKVVRTTDAAPALIGFGASSIGSLPQGYVQNAPTAAAYAKEIEGDWSKTLACMDAPCAGTGRSPDRELMMLREMTGATRYVGQIDIGGQSFSDVAKGIELFATKVAPALRKASA